MVQGKATALNYRNEILVGDVRERLRDLPDKSVHMVVTSPPYFGLRDYGTASWVGGDDQCDHTPPRKNRADRPAFGLEGGTATIDASEPMFKDVCGNCGATRVDSQIGLENTVAEYVDSLVAVFREVARVLRDDGTLWLNLGDSYAGSWGAQGRRGSTLNGSILSRNQITNHPKTAHYTGTIRDAGLKPKDLVGIPWRVAFALQADGWYLRSDIIWSKPNPMPESVTDRPTKAHEYLFLLSKAERYFYDAFAIRETSSSPEQEAHNQRYAKVYDAHTERIDSGLGIVHGNVNNIGIHSRPGLGGRNRRTVWEIATQPYAEAHFATFPVDLVQPCILAGTSEHGVCASCGAPWRRVVAKTESPHEAETASAYEDGSAANRIALARQAARANGSEYAQEVTTIGWEPTCYCGVPDGMDRGKANLAIECERGNWTPAPVERPLVLDPFMGSGTTARVALLAGRDFVGVELNPDYVALAEKRMIGDSGQDLRRRLL